MKIFFCTRCHELFNLGYEYKECSGKHGGGKYVDNLNAEVWGDREIVHLLGFANSTLADALRLQIKDGDQEGMMPYGQGFVRKGRDFTAFIIPESAPTVKRTEKKS